MPVDLFQSENPSVSRIGACSRRDQANTLAAEVTSLPRGGPLALLQLLKPVQDDVNLGMVGLRIGHQARFLGTGGLDTGFGDGGKVTVDFFGGGDGAEAVAVQTDGRIVVAGGASKGSSFRVGMIRIVP